ncbi:MAG TPA: hypothetical protein VGF88_14955 [Acidobacteriaceae bacterium]
MPASRTRACLNIGLIVETPVFVAFLLVAAVGWGQVRRVSSNGPNDWSMAEPEAEELAAVGLAGTGGEAAAFVNSRTIPKFHGPMWHVADVEGGYTSIRSTSSPLKCGCFTADGGNGSMVYHLTEHFGVAGDGARVWAPGAGSNQGLNLTTFLGGPQVSTLLLGHFLPFGHFLIGRAQADGVASQRAAGSASAFAEAWGGGVDLVMNQDTSVRLAEIDEDIMHFKGGTMDFHQSSVRLVFGVVFHFRTR